MNHPPFGKTRIDVLMVERGLAPSRERAQALIMAGQVLSEGQKIDKPGTRVSQDARVEITGPTLRYASRGGLKLEGALESFAIAPQGKICLDAGSSTGGFTDCLLQNGAAKVYAVDVTVNQLDWKLQQDKRVVLLERNVRHLQAADIADLITLITADLSFISVAKVLPALVSVAAPGADLLILIKPQFELEKREVGKGGIVRDPASHQKAVQGVVGVAARLGLEVAGVKPSQLPGAKGNQEFFLHARRAASNKMQHSPS
ncbi:MAG: TlyA family RNA methyltransferase [Candidatus Acidiferrales bacterium]|jgi:23S rRNA (cytidine1920-2'-O)/16S rRNA (cytidine1409-2'-O)-methyltransferase